MTYDRDHIVGFLLCLGVIIAIGPWIDRLYDEVKEIKREWRGRR